MVRLWYPAAPSHHPRAGYLTPAHARELVGQLNALAGTNYPGNLPIRVADMSFVLDRLTDLAGGNNPDAEHRRLPAGLGRALDLTASPHSATRWAARPW